MILWDLPIEFEVRSTSSVNIWSKLKVVTQMIVRDLWAMYISLTDLEAEPYKDVDDRGSRDGSSPDKEAAPEYHDPLAALYNALSDSASSTDSEPDATSDKSTRSESPKKSTGEATSGYGNYTSKSTRKPRKPFDPSRRLQMHYTLVICYLACLTLRLPVLMRDLLEYVAEPHHFAWLTQVQPGRLTQNRISRHIGTSARRHAQALGDGQDRRLHRGRACRSLVLECRAYLTLSVP